MDNDKSEMVKKALDIFSRLDFNTQEKYYEHLKQVIKSVEVKKLTNKSNS